MVVSTSLKHNPSIQRKMKNNKVIWSHQFDFDLDFWEEYVDIEYDLARSKEHWNKSMILNQDEQVSFAPIFLCELRISTFLVFFSLVLLSLLGLAYLYIFQFLFVNKRAFGLTLISKKKKKLWKSLNLRGFVKIFAIWLWYFTYLSSTSFLTMHFWWSDVLCLCTCFGYDASDSWQALV